MVIERKCIEHCAPTLARLKTGNLFGYRHESAEDARGEIEILNKKLNPKGVYVEQLVEREDFSLVYIYRRSFLERDLQRSRAREILSECGYRGSSVGVCMETLKARLKEYDEFPHEIGLFLGYPLEDVLGFMEHKGRNCKCCGAWKVYGDENEAQKLFSKLKKCSRVYAQVFSKGRNIVQMTVAA